MNQEPFIKEKSNLFFTEAQLKNEMKRCEYCEEKPCKTACPANCSPADFIMAAMVGRKWDIARAANLIMKNNPLGGVCGVVCPESTCQTACVHMGFDTPVNIPKIQATLIAKAKALKVLETLKKPKLNGKKIAIIGAGPSGLSAAATCARLGYKIDIFEKKDKPGGAMRLIPVHRLPREIIDTDIKFLTSLGNIKIKTNREIKEKDIKTLASKYDAVIIAAGLWEPIFPGVCGEEKAIWGLDYLNTPEKYNLKGNVAVYGGGATALDCATTLKLNGARKVVMFCLENLKEMPLTKKERQELIDFDIEVEGRSRLMELRFKKNKLSELIFTKVELKKGKKFSLQSIKDIKNSIYKRTDFDAIIISIGARSKFKQKKIKGVFYTGDCVNGPSTVVEAVASGKNTALLVDSYLKRKKKPVIKNIKKSEFAIAGFVDVPVSLETDFFGRKIISPFLLSAAPPSDGYEQMKKAYLAGWPGGIMKTTFHKSQGPIHIPAAYMFQLNEKTYGNCDNVSGHPMDRVVKEIKKLVKEFKDRLTMVSTGGPVTGNDKSDAKAWQRNTKILEDAGAMGIEYSLSCPQGGDGTEGDIVAQNAELTAKIVDWVMEVSDPDIPKLFKLTGAVTSIIPIARAIKKVFQKYPHKKAGITLANTFPAVAFREGQKKKWDEAIVIGMSGEGVTYISNMSLANVASVGLVVSGNGGPMTYKAAADFLALGAKTVQFCTLVMKYGYDIINEIHSGVSYLMKYMGIKNMKQLIGRALPEPITDFMELTSEKGISDVYKELCEHCGNCTRCSYLAISLDKDKIPVTDPEKCIGCSICVQKCFAGALYLRKRTKKELKLLKEN